MDINIYSLLLAAFSTLVIGSVWYHPKVFGTIWMRESRTQMDSEKMPSMIGIFITSFVYAFFISFILQFLVIHQFGAYASTIDITGIDPSVLENYIAAYGETYRTFKHGALHGFMTGLFLALPLIGNNSLYEKRSFKYVLIVGGYWVISMTIMGGIICSWK